MKLLILTLFLTLTAMASNKNDETLLVEEPLDQLTIGYGKDKFFDFRSEDTESACQKIQVQVSEYYATYKNSIIARCASVRPELTIASSSVSTSTRFKTSILWIVPGPTLNIPTGSVTHLKASVELFCEPRGIVEKLALQAYIGCEQSPKPECFTPEYMEAFKQVKKTRFVNNIVEQCRSKVQ